MRSVVFRDVFDMLERFTALFATIFVGGHGSSSGIDSAHAR
jgi:hypothetical protein